MVARLLIEHFLHRLNSRHRQRKSLPPDNLKRLLKYPWPGNIRELKNVLERLWLASTSDRA